MGSQCGRAPSTFTWPRTCQSWWRWWLHPWLPDHRPAPPEEKKKFYTGPKDRQAHLLFSSPLHKLSISHIRWEDTTAGTKRYSTLATPYPIAGALFSLVDSLGVTFLPDTISPQSSILTATQASRFWKHSEALAGR